jgi:cellobiose phosphorylase
VIPGTALPAYGHGDWNDALQPVDPAMRERLCSTWTATLHYQTLRALAAALDAVGQELCRAGRRDVRETAAALAANADRIREEFRRLLLVDGTLAGYAYFHDDGRIDHLLHPRDLDSDARYSVLPMIHAILAEMLTPEQARAHVDCIRGRLLGPEGVHLFDRPFRYRGGPPRRFQRVESATFFGREIGNMYMHAHLRWAEALARLGDADAFFLALRQANPVGVRDVVRSATLRQRNCYTSSQDPVFADRYEGFDHYDRVGRGDVALECGWRVYSSGAGIALRLVRECFLGLRQSRSALVVDPVVPRALDGLRARLDAAGATFDVTYRVRARGCGVAELSLNGSALPFERGHNPYRTGAARVALHELNARLRRGKNDLEIALE